MTSGRSFVNRVFILTEVRRFLPFDCELPSSSLLLLSYDMFRSILGSPINKIRDMMGVDGVKYEWKAEHILDVPLKINPERGEAWKLDHFELLDYPNDEFCIMFVYSNKDTVRIWLSELNPERMGAHTGTQFEMTIYKASGTLPRRSYGFASTVIPSIQPGLLTMESTFWEQCYEISKDDLLHVSELGTDEVLKFKVKIVFDVEKEEDASVSSGENALTASEEDQSLSSSDPLPYRGATRQIRPCDGHQPYIPPVNCRHRGSRPASLSRLAIARIAAHYGKAPSEAETTATRARVAYNRSAAGHGWSSGGRMNEVLYKNLRIREFPDIDKPE